jgi:hypothetical protein
MFFLLEGAMSPTNPLSTPLSKNDRSAKQP